MGNKLLICFRLFHTCLPAILYRAKITLSIFGAGAVSYIYKAMLPLQDAASKTKDKDSNSTAGRTMTRMIRWNPDYPRLIAIRIERLGATQ